MISIIVFFVFSFRDESQIKKPSDHLDAEENQTENQQIGTTAVQTPKPRKIVKAKHKVGFNSDWTVTRPWLYCKIEDSYEVMYCSLCQKHQTSGLNLSTVWFQRGCQSVRLFIY